MNQENINMRFYMAKIAKLVEHIKVETTKQSEDLSDVCSFIRSCQDPRIHDLKRQFIKNEGETQNIEPTKDVEPPIVNATFQSIYKACALRLHPDKPTGDTRVFQRLNDAYKKNDVNGVLEIIFENDLPVEIPKSIVKMLKNQYQMAKQNKKDMKSHWITYWKTSWTYEEKLAFLEQLHVL